MQETKIPSLPRWAALCACAALILRGIPLVVMHNIADCDETFNYWDPLHFLLYGSGLQTWEYSPQYALRSYAFLVLHAAIAWPARALFGLSKLHVFYAVRSFLLVLSAVSQTAFLAGLAHRFSRGFAAVAFVILLVSPGVLLASMAFLPSSFSMNMLFLCFGLVMCDYWWLSMCALAAATVLGWPFAGLCGVSAVIFMFFEPRCGFARTVFYGTAALALFLVPSFLIDTYFFGTPALSPLHLVVYNLPKSGGGSELYGVEPASFYVLNLLLNFNVAAPLAVLSLVLVPLWSLTQKPWHTLGSALLLLFPLVSMLSLFFMLPHKEERFLFVVYPFIVFAAAYSFHTVTWFIPFLLGRPFFRPLCLAAFLVFSASRMMALQNYYSAPRLMYEALHDHLAGGAVVRGTVCVGKEWYRFPSHFYFPETSPGVRIAFLRSGFGGQLPQYFTNTTAIPVNFNDQNREEMDRYVHVSACDYIVDLQLAEQQEPCYICDTAHFGVLAATPFLDAAQSRLPILRSFVVPSRLFELFPRPEMFFTKIVLPSDAEALEIVIYILLEYWYKLAEAFEQLQYSNVFADYVVLQRR